MISSSDLLHLISEIHQYSVVLLELREAITIGISNLSHGKMSYFQLEGTLNPADRNELARMLSAGQIPRNAQPISLEQMLEHLEGKKTKHIWLETIGQKELGFVSLSELKMFFRGHSHR